MSAFLDSTIKIVTLVGGGDTVAVEWVVEGTNTGPMHSPDGSEIRRPFGTSRSRPPAICTLRGVPKTRLRRAGGGRSSRDVWSG